MHQRALARAGAAQNGEGFAFLNGEGHVLQHVQTLVSKGHVVKDDVAADRLASIGSVLLLLCVEDIAHTIQRHTGLGHFRQHAAQRTHRPGQRLVVGDKSHKGAQGHAALYGLHNAAQNDDHHL